MEFKSCMVFTIFMFIAIAQAEVFDITKFGAKADAEISKALADAWAKVCSAPQPSQLLIPKGRYLLNTVEFNGPCKSPVEVKIDGTLIGPEDPVTIPKGSQWITFSYITAMKIMGSGTLDGVGGAMSWSTDDPKTTVEKGSPLQYNLNFNFIKDSYITGITSKDSKNIHMNLVQCTNVTVQDFKASAPGSSPNTIGIHVVWSKNINIKNCVIGTGDDCVSIGDGNDHVIVEGVKCGPGKGISIGGLGRNTGEKPVTGVTVKNCSFSSTLNGVWIKTWPHSHPGDAGDIHFEDLTMEKVDNPVFIQQDYCPHIECKKDSPSNVKIHNVIIKNVKGTSNSPEVVKLRCSKATKGCEKVEISNINLKYDGPAGKAIQECQHVKPIYSGQLVPPGCAKSFEDN
ncbi:polygalacturonase-like [Bidens hawaiensis]|uniref:polygalacturonase-like n=1 Tax=Bidens hawaiensis TaxID=980011 RepID=UPI00404B83B7